MAKRSWKSYWGTGSPSKSQPARAPAPELCYLGDGEEVNQDLEVHALCVADRFVELPVAGDGHCFFRAVVVHMPDNSVGHAALRAAVVAEVGANSLQMKIWGPGWRAWVLENGRTI